MRLLVLLLALLPPLALAQGPRVVRDLGTVLTGPRILGEPAFAFELDALSWDEPDRAGWAVTTTRPSTCMTYTGSEWVTRGEDEACVDSQGLQAFGGYTQYVANSADFSQPDWLLTRAAVTPVGDGFRVERLEGETQAIQIYQRSGTGISGEAWTASFEVRSVPGDPPITAFIRAAASSVAPTPCAREITGEWARLHCTQQLVGDGNLYPLIEVSPGEPVLRFEVRQAQLTKTPHPMPRHDCGETPCSRAGDVHTVSTEGWPVEAGEVRLQYTPIAASLDTSRWLLNASTFQVGGWELYVHSSGSLNFLSHRAGTNTLYSSGGLSWGEGVTYDIHARWGGGILRIWRDGVLVLEAVAANMPEGALPANARIGYRTTGAPAQGHIRLLRVSNAPSGAGGGTP